MSARASWLAILLVAVLAVALHTACSEAPLAIAPDQTEVHRAEIERVLAEDRAAYEQAPTEISVGTTKVDAYRGLVARLRAIDTSTCPTELPNSASRT